MTGPDDRRRRAAGLIGQVYDAALDERLWAGLAPGFARVFDSTSAVLTTRCLSTGHMRIYSLTGNFEQALVEAYLAHYQQIDPWAEGAARIALGKVVTGTEIVSDGNLVRTEFYEDWLRKLDIFHMVGSVFPVADDEVAILGIHRPRTGDAYGDQDQSLLTQFLPHLQRALQIQRRLSRVEMERQVALDALQRSGTATLVVARDGRIVYTNTQAEALLHKGDAIRAVGACLVIAEHSLTDRLIRLIHGAIDCAVERGGSSGGGLAIPRAGRLPLRLIVAPFRPAQNSFGAPAPAALLLIDDPEERTPSDTALQGLFGLTSTEAAVASALANGQSIEDIATRRGTSVNTVRTQLKRIFDKTGTCRQAELVAHLLRSVAALGIGESN